MNTTAIDVQPTAPPQEAQVCSIIARCLNREAGSVIAEASLFDELGADSLDLLDIVFALEQEFSIEITRGALEKAARGDMGEDEFAPDGEISEAGLERLREVLPEAAHRIHSGLKPREIPRLFSARTFARIVSAQQGNPT